MNSREQILSGTIQILEDMTSDWDIGFSGGISEGTKLIGDLGFESIDVVQLVGSIEEKFGRRGLPFEEILIKNGNYVDELHVSDIAEFLHRHLGQQA